MNINFFQSHFLCSDKPARFHALFRQRLRDLFVTMQILRQTARFSAYVVAFDAHGGTGVPQVGRRDVCCNRARFVREQGDVIVVVGDGQDLIPVQSALLRGPRRHRPIRA